MRDRALFHLLMARAHSLAMQSNGDPFVEALRRTLKIAYGRDGYALSWSFRDQDFSLEVSNDDFALYGPGDRYRKDRPPSTTVRAKNWEAAGNLLKRLAAESGTQLSGPAETDTLSIYPAPQQKGEERVAKRAALIVGSALAASLAAWLIFPGYTVLDGFAAVLAGALLCAALQRMNATEIDRNVPAWSVVVTAAAPAFAVGVTGQTWAPLAFVLPFVAAIELEWHARDTPSAAWLAAGFAGLGAIVFLGWAGWASLGAIIAFLWIFRTLSPIRFGRSQVLAYSAGAAAAALLSLGVIGSAAPPGAAPLQGEATFVIVLAGAFSAASVIFRVMRGSMYLVLPWAMLIATLSTVLFALIGKNAGAAAAAIGMCGYLFFYVEDCTMWMLRSSQKRIIKG